MDEFDALGAARGAQASGDESAQIINELLVGWAAVGRLGGGWGQQGGGAGGWAGGSSLVGGIGGGQLPHATHPLGTPTGRPTNRLPNRPTARQVQMDGFEDNRGIVVLGATNRPGAIDSALVRPGRFDRIIYMPLPDATGRAKILQARQRSGRDLARTCFPSLSPPLSFLPL